jgi:Spy/CpxP family protein refolding chaperone
MNRVTRHTKVSRLRAVAIAASAALALSFGATAASAQPAGGHHGMHGGGGFGDMIPHMLERAKASLNLNTMQQGMWDNVVAQGKAAREAGRANMQQVKAALQAQLANPAPDLAAVAAVADQVQAQNSALRKGVRDQWLQLYATFTPDQKAVVRDLLQKKVAHAESFRERMAERFHGKGGTSTN